MNTYSFVTNNPVNAIDPSGLCREDDDSETGRAPQNIDEVLDAAIKEWEDALENAENLQDCLQKTIEAFETCNEGVESARTYCYSKGYDASGYSGYWPTLSGWTSLCEAEATLAYSCCRELFESYRDVCYAWYD